MPEDGTMTAGVRDDGWTRSPHSHPLPLTGSIQTAFVLSGVAAILLIVTAVTGLLYGGDGLYPADPLLLRQFYGQDAIALMLGLPTLLISMWYVRRGSTRALVLWLGSLIYIAYWYHF